MRARQGAPAPFWAKRQRRTRYEGGSAEPVEGPRPTSCCEALHLGILQRTGSGANWCFSAWHRTLGWAPMSSRLLRIGLGLAAAVFTAWTAVLLFRQWEPSAVSIRLPWVFAGLAVAMAACSAQARGFIGQLEYWSGRRLPTLPALSFFFTTQLGRYTPGKVGLPAMRLAGAERLQISLPHMGAVTILEAATWLGSGLLVALTVLALHPSLPAGWEVLFGVWYWVILGAGVITLTATLTIDRSRYLGAWSERWGLGGKGPLLSPRLPLWMFAHWAAWIGHGMCLGAALGASPSAGPFLGGSLILGIFAGFFALVVPGGMGVREAVFSMAAAPLIGPSRAIVLGLLARGLSLGAEILLALIFRGLSAFEMRRSGLTAGAGAPSGHEPHP
jgi:glycosyltransferase 2 family protein